MAAQTGARPQPHLYRRYSSAGLAHGAVDMLRGAGRVVFRPQGNSRQPFIVEPIRKQLREAAQMLGVMVLAGPLIFMAADWLRYGA